MAEEEKKHFRMRDHIPEETREHLKTAREEMRKSYEALMPPGFLEHRRAARKEFLLAARSLIDAALKRIDEK
ncbi:MAG: hypothetical protein FJ030_19105 [Chloroflexi bacterium]|nr:hypothetical protein [Chloroflexota bacterium]